MEQLDHLEVAQEAVRILRGRHPAWPGQDPVAECQAFLVQAAEDFGNTLALANDLTNNRNDFAQELGVSPDRIVWMANRLRCALN